MENLLDWIKQKNYGTAVVKVEFVNNCMNTKYEGNILGLNWRWETKVEVSTKGSYLLSLNRQRWKLYFGVFKSKGLD